MNIYEIIKSNINKYIFSKSVKQMQMKFRMKTFRIKINAPDHEIHDEILQY